MGKGENIRRRDESQIGPIREESICSDVCSRCMAETRNIATSYAVSEQTKHASIHIEKLEVRENSKYRVEPGREHEIFSGRVPEFIGILERIGIPERVGNKLK